MLLRSSITFAITHIVVIGVCAPISDNESTLISLSDLVNTFEASNFTTSSNTFNTNFGALPPDPWKFNITDRPVAEFYNYENTDMSASLQLLALQTFIERLVAAFRAEIGTRSENQPYPRDHFSFATSIAGMLPGSPMFHMEVHLQASTEQGLYYSDIGTMTKVLGMWIVSFAQEHTAVPNAQFKIFDEVEPMIAAGGLFMVSTTPLEGTGSGGLRQVNNITTS